jgi:hypothetical protein
MGQHTYVGYIFFGPAVQTIDRCALFITIAILSVGEVMSHSTQAP